MRQALPIVIVAVLLTRHRRRCRCGWGQNSRRQTPFLLRNACRHQRSGAQRHEEFSN